MHQTHYGSTRASLEYFFFFRNRCFPIDFVIGLTAVRTKCSVGRILRATQTRLTRKNKMTANAIRLAPHDNLIGRSNEQDVQINEFSPSTGYGLSGGRA